MVQKILVTRHMGAPAHALLDASGFELIVNPADAEPSRAWVLEHVADPDVVAVALCHSQPSDKVDAEFLAAASPGLKVVSTLSVGYDHIDVKAAQAIGIKVGHTPGVLDNAVADITVTLVLMTMRRVGEGIELVKSGGWPQLPWGPFVLCGPSISHPSLTLSFLGFGRIAQQTLYRLLAFTSRSAPPTVLYHSSAARADQAELDAAHSARFGVAVRRVEADELARRADVLVVLCALTESTKGLVDSAFLDMMKPTAVLVNAARGPIVNTDDLARALDEGKLFGAGLDVITNEPHVGPENPLVRHPKCIVIPHMGSADYDTRNAMADLCARNAIAGAKDEALVAEVTL
ncbi:hypothetical protein Q5752_000436 [Cryptotrichosporon argae]